LAKENDIKVEPKELDAEITLIKTSYPDNETIQENLKRPEVIDTIAVTIQNKKVLAWLKEKVVSKK
jgi:FKBP-type peptidyl-prolyl cis-trans isomerase (trigger factor)